MSICLSVNLNKIALIRNSRAGDYPSVTEHARLCVEAGADGITVHPRPDQRHIRAGDVPALAAMLAVELNVEGNPFAGPAASQRAAVADYPGFMALVRAVRPRAMHAGARQRRAAHLGSRLRPRARRRPACAR